MTKLFYSEIIEKAFTNAEKLALDKKQFINPLHFLASLIKIEQSDSSKILAKYIKDLEDKISLLPSQGVMDKTIADKELAAWVKLAQSNALKHKRDFVKEEDFLEKIGEFFNLNVRASSSPQDKVVAPSYQELASELTDGVIPTYLSKIETKSELILENETLLTSVIESLSRQDCNNVLVYGEKGVGKTSLVKALVQRIESQNVPSFLKNKSIFKLKTTLLTLNVHNPRDISNRMELVLNFIKEKAESRILYISDFDLCLKNPLLLDNIKFYVLEHNLNIVAEVGYDNFDLFNKDAQLKSQFNVLFVKEPSIEESVLVLEKLAPSYETSKGIYISKEVIQSVVELSAKQISGQFLPSKAIDVLEQACSKFSLRLEMPGSEEASLQDRVNQLESAVKYSKDKSKVSELESVVKKLNEVKQVRKTRVEKFHTVPALQFEINSLKERLDLTTEEKLLYQTKVQELNSLKEEVSLNKMDICEVISQITEIPKEKIAQSKQDHILNMASSLEQRVFGQSEPIKKITDVLMTSFAGLTAEQKPLGSFLLLGPSGVGKTEIAKALTELLFDHEKYMIRLDLSEYSEKHSVAKLIGAPAGYSGYDDGGVLTEAVRKNPYSVILFDEVEKGHKDFADILLQILDDGRLTDNKGRTVNFNNSIIFLTSNLADPTTYFRPEMIGRFSGVVKFNSLSVDVMPLLVNKELKSLNKKLAKQNIKLKLGPSLIEFLGKQGHSEKYGARPLINLFSDKVSKPLGQQILAGNLKEGNFLVELKDEMVEFIKITE